MNIQAMQSFSALMLLASVASYAQIAPVSAQEPTQTPGVIQPHYIRTGLFYLTGGGGNSVVRLSGEGALIVDGKRAENYQELRQRIKKVAMERIRLVINTDHYEDHAGTNAQFIADKIPVLGQANEVRSVMAYQPTSGKIAPPSNTYDTNQTLHLGLVQAQVLHFGNGRTGEDTVVYFPDEQAVALGDLYAAAPEPDYAAGGSLLGWSHSLGEVLKLDFKVAIPGNGPIVSKADVESFKKKIDSTIARAGELVKTGVPSDQLAARLRTEDVGWQLNWTPEQAKGLYAELTSGASGSSEKPDVTSKNSPATK